MELIRPRRIGNITIANPRKLVVIARKYDLQKGNVISNNRYSIFIKEIIFPPRDMT